MKRIIAGMLACICILFAGTASRADVVDYDYFGSFPYHNTVLTFTFSVEDVSDVTLFSSSYANGGFDPMLFLWNGDGSSLLESQDDHPGGVPSSALSNGVSYPVGDFDAYFVVNALPIGEYIVAISAYANWHNGSALADGFYFDNQTPIPIAQWDQPASGFRAADFAFHILNVARAEGPPTATPEPATLALMGIGLAGVHLLRRRRKV